MRFFFAYTVKGSINGYILIKWSNLNRIQVCWVPLLYQLVWEFQEEQAWWSIYWKICFCQTSCSMNFQNWLSLFNCLNHVKWISVSCVIVVLGWPWHPAIHLAQNRITWIQAVFNTSFFSLLSDVFSLSLSDKPSKALNLSRFPQSVADFSPNVRFSQDWLRIRRRGLSLAQESKERSGYLGILTQLYFRGL